MKVVYWKGHPPIRNTKIQIRVLKSIAIAGIIAAGLVAPNVVQLIPYIEPSIGRKKKIKEYTRTALERLIKKRLVLKKITSEGTFVELTPLGRKTLEIFETRKFELPDPKRWDKKWRMVVFDINERRKKFREHLRATLVRIGFVRLQDSVWVYPYDCQELIALLKVDFHVGKDVLYVIADSIENDFFLRKHFNLA